jgi:adenosylcobinamide-phosphate synthase
MYKAVNTLDSTFGYRTEEYRDFGWASARLDDVVNWIPARLTGPCVLLAAFLTGRPIGPAVEILRRDRKNHDSPNAGIPEAAFAGSLQVQLGGVNSYFGVPQAKPAIGDRIDNLRSTHIPAANRLMYVSSVVFLLGSIAVRFLFTFGGAG